MMVGDQHFTSQREAINHPKSDRHHESRLTWISLLRFEFDVIRLIWPRMFLGRNLGTGWNRMEPDPNF